MIGEYCQLTTKLSIVPWSIGHHWNCNGNNFKLCLYMICWLNRNATASTSLQNFQIGFIRSIIRHDRIIINNTCRCCVTLLVSMSLQPHGILPPPYPLWAWIPPPLSGRQNRIMCDKHMQFSTPLAWDWISPVWDQSLCE